MDRLPVELVIDVLNDAQYTRDHCLPHRDWLRNYCLVSKKWRPYAQKLLFRRVVLVGGGKQCMNFKQVMSSSTHSAFLYGCIQTLILSMDHQDVYADIICMCTQLQQLDLQIHHASFRAPVLTHLRENAPRIQSLRVRSLNYPPLFQLLQLFPTIRYLSLDLLSARVPPSLPSTPNWQLRELRLHCLKRDVANMLNWALPSPESRQTLQILHLDEAPEPSIFIELMSSIGPNLRSLRLKHVSAEIIPAISACTRLEELVISSIPPSNQLLEALPRTLEHLMFSHLTNQLDDILLRLRRHQEQTNDGLQVITYECLSHRDRNVNPGSAASSPDVQGLRKLCHLGGITFRLMDPVYGSYVGELEPLGPVTTFPRDAPVCGRRIPLPELLDDDGKPLKRPKFKLLERAKLGLAKSVLRRQRAPSGSSASPTSPT